MKGRNDIILDSSSVMYFSSNQINNKNQIIIPNTVLFKSEFYGVFILQLVIYKVIYTEPCTKKNSNTMPKYTKWSDAPYSQMIDKLSSPLQAVEKIK